MKLKERFYIRYELAKKQFSVLRRLVLKYKILSYATLFFLTLSNLHLRSENNQLALAISDLQVVVKSLEKDNLNVKDNMIIYNRDYEDFPLEYWEKAMIDKKFVAQYFNPKYVQSFGHHFDYDRFKYIGFTDFDIYSKPIAERYFQVDSLVAKNGVPIKTNEFYLDKKGRKKKLRVIKWRKVVAGVKIICGMVLFKEE